MVIALAVVVSAIFSDQVGRRSLITVAWSPVARLRPDWSGCAVRALAAQAVLQKGTRRDEGRTQPAATAISDRHRGSVDPSRGTG